MPDHPALAEPATFDAVPPADARRAVILVTVFGLSARAACGLRRDRQVAGLSGAQPPFSRNLEEEEVEAELAENAGDRAGIVARIVEGLKG